MGLGIIGTLFDRLAESVGGFNVTAHCSRRTLPRLYYRPLLGNPAESSARAGETPCRFVELPCGSEGVGQIDVKRRTKSGCFDEGRAL